MLTGRRQWDIALTTVVDLSPCEQCFGGTRLWDVALEGNWEGVAGVCGSGGVLCHAT